MDTRTNFLLQLLQKLGAPLMAAVNMHGANNPDETGARDAQVMAALLSESVKISISLSQSLNLKPDDGDADAIRVALAALAGSLVADSYKQQGRMPNENDSRRIAKALESVIAFSDNFAPAAQHAQRLQTLDGAVPFFDPVQTSIYSMHAMVPVIAAISEFSFGQDANRLVQDVAGKLGARVKALKDTLGTNVDGMGELVTLQALAQMYASAHRAETIRLQAAGDQDGAASVDTVWASFDRQVAMLEILMTSMSGGSSASAAGGGGVKPAIEAPAEETTAAPPPQAVPPAAAGGNPMSFFKKK